MSTIRAARKDEIAHLIRVAKKRSYNRQIDPKTISVLDPEGTNLLSVAMIHEHAAGVPVEPHYRCRVYLKYLDQASPVIGMLDVPMDKFNKLEEVNL